MESSEKYEEYVSFEEFISYVREFLYNVHLDTGIKMESPTFNEIDLDEKYSIVFSDDYLLNRKIFFNKVEMNLINKMRIGYAIFYLMRNSASPKKGVLGKEFHRVFYWIIDATEMFQKDHDIKSFFLNLIKALTIANNEFYKDKDYQIYHKTRYNSSFQFLKLKEEIRIQY